MLYAYLPYRCYDSCPSSQHVFYSVCTQLWGSKAQCSRKAQCMLQAAELTVAFLLSLFCQDAYQHNGESSGEIRSDEAAEIQVWKKKKTDKELLIKKQI